LDSASAISFLFSSSYSVRRPLPSLPTRRSSDLFIDALFAGIPSISTKVGAEAMFKDQEWPGFIADETEEIVDKAVSLYQEQQIWEAASNRSKQILRSLIDPNWGKELTDALEKIQQNLESHSRKNIIGQILWSNQFLSSKYLSQWIEEKNRK